MQFAIGRLLPISRSRSGPLLINPFHGECGARGRINRSSKPGANHSDSCRSSKQTLMAWPSAIPPITSTLGTDGVVLPYNPQSGEARAPCGLRSRRVADPCIITEINGFVPHLFARQTPVMPLTGLMGFYLEMGWQHVRMPSRSACGRPAAAQVRISHAKAAIWDPTSAMFSGT